MFDLQHRYVIQLCACLGAIWVALLSTAFRFHSAFELCTSYSLEMDFQSVFLEENAVGLVVSNLAPPCRCRPVLQLMWVVHPRGGGSRVVVTRIWRVSLPVRWPLPFCSSPSGPEVSSSRMRGQPCRVPVAGGGRDNWFNNGSGNKKREIKIIFIVLGPIMSCSFEA